MSAAQMQRLTASFFRQPPDVCARKMIGSRLVWRECKGEVVETEAYAAMNDQACHTFTRRSARDFVSRYDAGAAYVYLNYGMYWLLNVLVKGEVDGFVLIRALRPLQGLDVMARRRKRANERLLCSGPGKLCQALGISGEDHGRDLCSEDDIGLFAAPVLCDVSAGPRVGISKEKELPWRFAMTNSPWVSHPRLAK